MTKHASTQPDTMQAVDDEPDHLHCFNYREIQERRTKLDQSIGALIEKAQLLFQEQS